MAEPGDQIRFSVVVLAYNEAAYLGRALDSLQHQDYDGTYEIIVVDNNSSDDTAAIAAGYGVRVVRERQHGVCAARQRGVDAAYWLNRLSQRQTFGMAPAFRQEQLRPLAPVWTHRRAVLGVASEAALDSLTNLWIGP